MLLCIAEGSGLFLPYRFGKLVIMVSRDDVRKVLLSGVKELPMDKTYFHLVSTAKVDPP
jgi:hypothetical protein